MNKLIELLNPVQTVDLGDEQIEVREMRWVDALAFLDKLAGSLEQVIGSQSIGEDGSLRLNGEKLREAVLSGGDLANTLLSRSTGLPQERLDQLTASQALTILEAAVAINFREHLLGKFQAVGKSLQGMLTVARPTR
jgi:hypothetical protein